MNKLYCLIIVLFTYEICHGQNLVLNNSFENFSSCPTSASQIGLATGWTTSSYSPDYYNACANGISPNFGVPSNIMGYQNAASGNGYVGIFCFGLYGGSYVPNIREWATGTLSQPLTKGVKYYVRLKVVLANSSAFAINNIGARFLLSTTASLQNIAHVYTNVVITDTLNWTIIDGTFIADTNYTYISIGNHFNDALSDTVQTRPITSSNYNAYYFIDDVFVTPDSTTEIKEIKKSEMFNLFPIPFSQNLNITSKSNDPSEIILYDLTQRKILQHKFTHKTTISTIEYPKGIYLYEVRDKSGVIKKGKVVKE